MCCLEAGGGGGPIVTCQTLGSSGAVGAAGKDGLEQGPGRVVRAAWPGNVVSVRWKAAP